MRCYLNNPLHMLSADALIAIYNAVSAQPSADARQAVELFNFLVDITNELQRRTPVIDNSDLLG